MRMALGDIVHTTSLAKEFGVSERTIQLDMKDLALSYDIVSDKKGYYRLKETPKPIDKEMREIVKSLLYSLGIDTFPEFKEEIEDILGANSKKYLIFDTKSEKINNFSDFKLILQMLRWNYSIEIEYNGKKRTIHPFKIANLNNYWYLIAFELNSNKLKSFLLNKITFVKPLFSNMLNNNAIENEMRKKLNQNISPWINEDLKEMELIIYEPLNDTLKRKLPLNTELIKHNKDHSIIKLFYFDERDIMSLEKKTNLDKILIL